MAKRKVILEAKEPEKEKKEHKKDHTFSNLFWGGLIFLLGISILLDAIFHVGIPFGVFVGIFFLYLGINIILHNSHKK